MTPGQLHLLLEVHRAVKTGKPRRRTADDVGPTDSPAALFSLAGMRRG